MEGLDLASQVTTAESYSWGLEQLEQRTRSGYSAGSESAPASAALLSAHEHAFRHFGGVPRRLVLDNLKAAVQKVLDETGVPGQRNRLVGHGRKSP